MQKLFTKNDIQQMINKGMTLEQIEAEIGFENIGQGFGYKSEEAFMLGSSFSYEDTYICYIPEACYKHLSDDTKQIDLDSCYTRKDFIDLTKDKTKAEVLFESVDWQHPSSLWEEWGNDFELGKIAESEKTSDPLMAFIEQEVPYRLKTHLDYAVSDDIVAALVAKVQEYTDVMFDYDKFDDFLRNQCEHLLRLDFTKDSFIDDEEKMKDFYNLSKEEFLESYSYLTEEEYENTKLLVSQDMFVFDEEVLVNDDNESLNGYLWAVDALVGRLPASDNKENIKFYVDYNLKTGEIKLTSTYDILVDDGEQNKVADISLSNNEKQKLIYAFNQYCRKDYGKSCLYLLNETRLEEGLEPLVSTIKKPNLSDRIKMAETKNTVLAEVNSVNKNGKNYDLSVNEGR